MKLIKRRIGPPIFNFLFNSLLVLSLMLIAGKLRSQWERERERGMGVCVWDSPLVALCWPDKALSLGGKERYSEEYSFSNKPKRTMVLKGTSPLSLFPHPFATSHRDENNLTPIQYNTAHFHKLHIHHIVTTPHQHHQHILPHINRVKKKTSHG